MLQKLVFRPGINKDVTRSAGEGGWYNCDKVRFRQGYPEKIGGWERISGFSFLGVCRSLWNWSSLSGQNLLGIGTHLKFYVELGGQYYDVTPVRSTDTLTNPFGTTSGLTTVDVTDISHGAVTGDYVTFSGATAVGGLTIDGEYVITVVDVDSYTIEAASAASSTATGGGTVTAAYQINIGTQFNEPTSGWGAGAYGAGAYGEGEGSTQQMRLWSQSNFGEDLVFAPRGGKPMYWDSSAGISTRGTFLEDAASASGVPTKVNIVLVSDISRFVFAFGCDDVGSTPFSPMRVRWSDQESAVNWTPAATNQAGSLELSRGSKIVSAKQSRQEVLVWTDSAMYSLQYLGAPDVWGAQLLGSNLSISGQNAVAIANGVSYWMGRKTFYRYDGSVQPLPCPVRRYVFDDFNFDQEEQVVAGTNERFNEVWWFYCSAGSTAIDRYVVYNYVENVWYNGNMGRTAWIESGLRENPLAATYSGNIVGHETGTDDRITAVAAPITASITSSMVFIDDGDKYFFIRKAVPDVTFEGSESDSPGLSVEFQSLKNPGSGYNDPMSVGGESTRSVAGSAPGALAIDTFTQELNVRLRGRCLMVKYESTGLGVAWQAGDMRVDIRTSGERG